MSVRPMRLSADDSLAWAGSHPTIRDTLCGNFRKHGIPQPRAASMGPAELRRLVAPCGNDLTGLRAWAMLLLGCAAALRRSELVAVQREHVVFTAEGLRLLIPRAKTDQEGQGAEIGVPRGA